MIKFLDRRGWRETFNGHFNLIFKLKMSKDGADSQLGVKFKFKFEIVVKMSPPLYENFCTHHNPKK
jgi:hypothetical protein